MYSSIKNHQIYYQKLGKGKDLIMLHGWGQDVSSFWDVAQQLKDDFTVWLIDLPGFGRSEIKKDFSVSDYAEIVKGFIEENKIKMPHLLGHSLGGNISIKLTSTHHELIDRLILEGSSGIRPQKTFARIVIIPLAKLFNLLIPEAWGIKKKIRLKFYQSTEGDYINAGPLKKTIANILSEDLSDQLSKIKNETLLLWGENDRSVPLKYARAMYKSIEKSRLEILDDIGHFPHLESPKMFVYFMKDFVS